MHLPGAGLRRYPRMDQATPRGMRGNTAMKIAVIHDYAYVLRRLVARLCRGEAHQCGESGGRRERVAVHIVFEQPLRRVTFWSPATQGRSVGTLCNQFNMTGDRYE
jgi:hypothetical protein